MLGTREIRNPVKIPLKVFIPEAKAAVNPQGFSTQLHLRMQIDAHVTGLYPCARIWANQYKHVSLAKPHIPFSELRILGNF